MFLLATLLIGGMMLTGCKKNPDNPTPTSKTYKVVYMVANTYVNTNGEEITMSPCFKLDVTYIGADGQSVTETNCTLPWEKTIEITRPFHAKMEGTFSFNEADLPDPVFYGRRLGIGGYKDDSIYVSLSGSINPRPKAQFLETVTQDPNKLYFLKEKDF